jgi:Zn/Cd-binding protein ZinT
MKRLLLVCLMMTCSVSYAEWEFATDTNSATFYVDKTTIKKNGNFIKMWTKTDLKSVDTTSNGKNYLGLKTLFLFNCKDEEIGVVSQVFFSEHSYDKVVDTVNVKQSEVNFHSFSPDSIFSAIWKIACGKK